MRSPIPKLPAYPADHPFAIALAAMARAVRTGNGMIQALDEQARTANVLPGSEAYVPRATRDRADSLHFTEAHLALT